MCEIICAEYFLYFMGGMISITTLCALGIMCDVCIYENRNRMEYVKRKIKRYLGRGEIHVSLLDEDGGPII